MYRSEHTQYCTYLYILYIQDMYTIVCISAKVWLSHKLLASSRPGPFLNWQWNNVGSDSDCTCLTTLALVCQLRQ